MAGELKEGKKETLLSAPGWWRRYQKIQRKGDLEMAEATYKVAAETTPDGSTLLRLSFGTPAQNDQIVRDAVAALGALSLQGGQTVYLNGPASLPVACALAHGVAHLFEEVAVFDPKMACYVVAISHGGREVGTIVRL